MQACSVLPRGSVSMQASSLSVFFLCPIRRGTHIIMRTTKVTFRASVSSYRHMNNSGLEELERLGNATHSPLGVGSPYLGGLTHQVDTRMYDWRYYGRMLEVFRNTVAHLLSIQWRTLLGGGVHGSEAKERFVYLKPASNFGPLNKLQCFR